MGDQRRTIVFFPEGAFGPTNNCVGISDVLRRRAHRVVFIVEGSFAGALETRGFEERHMRLGPPPEHAEEPDQFWKDFIRDTAPRFRRPTIDQLEAFLLPTWQALVDGSRYVDARLAEIVNEVRPDVVVEDDVGAFPALVSSGRPWVRIVSCNPAELRDPLVPPTFSGYPTVDPAGWTDFIHESPWLNLYLYPARLDYPRARPLGQTWHRLDSSVRRTEAEFRLPERFA